VNLLFGVLERTCDFASNIYLYTTRPTLDICFTYRAFLEWLGKNVVITKIGMLAISTHFKETFRVNVSSLITQYVQDDSFFKLSKHKHTMFKPSPNVNHPSKLCKICKQYFNNECMITLLSSSSDLKKSLVHILEQVDDVILKMKITL
jgi:hypothetical protein